MSCTKAFFRFIASIESRLQDAKKTKFPFSNATTIGLSIEADKSGGK